MNSSPPRILQNLWEIYCTLPHNGTPRKIDFMTGASAVMEILMSVSGNQTVIAAMIRQINRELDEYMTADREIH